ncbi:MAG: hypothetical protein ACE5HO_15690 [bacterium]
MSSSLKLRIHQVDYFEIMKLNGLIEALTLVNREHDVITTNQGKDYLIMVESETSEEVDKVLATVMQNIAAKRVTIVE